MFSEINPESPNKKQHFMWVAEYFGDKFLSEFDVNTKKENNFKDIEKDKLVRFGLVGNSKKMWFECNGGTFNIVGRKIDVIFQANGKDYPLTGNGNNFLNDVITYKQATIDASLGRSSGTSGKFTSKIIGYFFGYKTQMKINDLNFTFKPIVSLPLSKPAYMQINLMVDEDIDGKLIFIRNREVVDEFDKSFVKGKSEQINWLIK